MRLKKRNDYEEIVSLRDVCKARPKKRSLGKKKKDLDIKKEESTPTPLQI